MGWNVEYALFVSFFPQLVAGLILTLLIGSVTPIFELRRIFAETYQRLNTRAIVYEEACTENEIFNSAKFSGNIDESLFYKYFGKIVLYIKNILEE